VDLDLSNESELDVQSHSAGVVLLDIMISEVYVDSVISNDDSALHYVKLVQDCIGTSCGIVNLLNLNLWVLNGLTGVLIKQITWEDIDLESEDVVDNNKYFVVSPEKKQPNVRLVSELPLRIESPVWILLTEQHTEAQEKAIFESCKHNANGAVLNLNVLKLLVKDALLIGPEPVTVWE